MSDHAPLIVNLGLNTQKVVRPFKFELCWFLREDLVNVVGKVWVDYYRGKSRADKWQNRGRKLRKVLKGWNLNYVWLYKKQKKVLSAAIDEIDRESERVGLSNEKYLLRKHLDTQLNKIYKEEEVMWFQRAKEQEILEGDALTSYFISKASGRKRKNKIDSLTQEDGVIEGDEEILDYATNFYKKLFGPNDNVGNVTINLPMSSVLSETDKEKLCQAFSMEEIKYAVFQMKKNKAPGPDGLPIEFYQVFWNLVSNDLFHMFQDWYNGALDVSRFNYGLLTLLPKSNDANSIQQYRPICLLNVIFKIFTKVVNNRANSIANKVVSPVQSAFIKGRFILDGVVSLHEVMHEVHRKK